MRSCPCGASLEGRQSNARYCSAVCRSRANKRRVKPVSVISPNPGRLAASTRAESESLGVAGPLAVAALLLAEQADAADARALPALMREWRAAMAELRAAAVAGAAVNPFDELRRRRERAG